MDPIDEDISDDFDDQMLRLSTQSLGFLAEKQKELLRLNAELDARKEEVVRHADEVVKEQQDRLRQLLDVGYGSSTARLTLDRTVFPALPVEEDVVEEQNKPEEKPVLEEEKTVIADDEATEIRELSASLRERSAKKPKPRPIVTPATHTRHNDVSSPIVEAMRDLPAPAAVRLLQAQVRALEEQSGGMNEVIQTRENELRDALDRMRELEEERTTFKKSARDNELTVEKLRKQLDDMTKKCHDFESRFHQASKELISTRKHAKQGDNDASAREARLQQATDELHRVKAALGNERTGRREAVDKLQRQLDITISDAKKLQRQKKELLSTFKRQMKMIDTLKRQKAMLEASRLLAFTEEEFVRSMDV